jgi:hypothetical protein
VRRQAGPTCLGHGSTGGCATPRRPHTEAWKSKELPMLDIILIAVGCSAFALAIAYAYACDGL